MNSETAAKITRARELGTEHGSKGDLPYIADGEPPAGYHPCYPEGYTSYVYWDAGSALLMDALAEHGDPPDDDTWEARRLMTEAYCEAYAKASGTPWDPR